MSSLWLNKFRKNYHSQNGEDGVLEEIFRHIGTTNKYAIEFGAWDGIKFSNTFHLIEQGWRGLMIETDPARYEELSNNMKGSDVVCRQMHVCRIDELDFVDPDLLSVDVDGEDYNLFDGMNKMRPHVVVIEVNSSISPNVDKIPGILPMVRLAKFKKYELALHTGNCIFVRREHADSLDIDRKHWQELFDPSWL
jgi:hypothetical protein